MSDLKNSMLAREELKWGLIFISPWIIGFLVFYLAPMVASFGFSLYDFNLATPEQAKYVGFANWKRFFFDDPQAVPAIIKTFKFGLITVPISLLTSLFLAILLNSKNCLFRFDEVKD